MIHYKAGFFLILSWHGDGQLNTVNNDVLSRRVKQTMYDPSSISNVCRISISQPHTFC